MNLSFRRSSPRALMMAIAGILIGQMTSNAAIAGIGDSLGRGTIHHDLHRHVHSAADSASG